MQASESFEKPDLSYLMQLMDHDTEIIVEVLRVFKQEVPKDIVKLQTHLNEKNWEMLGLTAHKLKSSVANLGLSKLSDIFLFIEQNGKENTNIDKLPRYVDLSIKNMNQLMIDIDLEINQLQAG